MYSSTWQIHELGESWAYVEFFVLEKRQIQNNHKQGGCEAFDSSLHTPHLKAEVHIITD